MGGCTSKLSRNLKAYRKYSSRFGKRRSKISATIPDVNIKAIGDSRNHARDFSVSEFVHLDFEKGAATNRARSEVSNMTFHLKQLQWSHGQIDANGIFLPLSILYSKVLLYLVSHDKKSYYCTGHS